MPLAGGGRRQTPQDWGRLTALIGDMIAAWRQVPRAPESDWLARARRALDAIPPGADPDWPALDGGVHDPQRIDFLARYLRELRRAAREIPVQGYFLWSWMDNFEWTGGYGPRYGIVYVDYATQRRICKDSALWYRDVIAANGANL